MLFFMGTGTMLIVISGKQIYTILASALRYPILPDVGPQAPKGY